MRKMRQNNIKHRAVYALYDLFLSAMHNFEVTPCGNIDFP